MDNYNSTANFHIAVIKDKSLSYLDKIVYIVLCSHADNEARECSPKVALIAEEASCSPRAVHKSLNNLEKHGVVSRKRRFVDHRQISSLYKIIGGKSQQNFADEDVGNSTTQTHTYFEGRTECRDTVRTEFTDEGRTVCRATVNNVQSLNTLRIFNNSLKGEACLPASAEKESSSGNPEERTSQEEAKNSLTGEALLPISQQQEPKEQQEKPQATENTQDSIAEDPVIKAETHTDTEKPEGGACLPPPAEQEEKILTQDEKLRRYYELRRKCEEEHRKAEAEACLPAPAENETTPEEPKVPQTEGSTLPDYLIKQYEQKRKMIEEMMKPMEAPKTAKVEMQKALDKMIKPSVASAECTEAPITESKLADKTLVAKTEPMETSNPPVAGDRHMNADNAPKPVEAGNPPTANNERVEHRDPPAVKSQPMEVSDPPVVRDGHMNADNAPKPAEISDTPVAREEPPVPKEMDRPTETSNKGKYSGGGNSKDVYPVNYAPDIMRPTAEYFLFKTGRKGLRWEEVSVLRKLSATQYPTRVNKEIERACERFRKRNQSLLCLTLMYIWAALKNQPTWGSKAKQKTKQKAETQIEVVAKPMTEEEKQAIQAEIDRLQAKFDEEERQRCMRRRELIFGR